MIARARMTALCLAPLAALGVIVAGVVGRG